MKTIFFIFMLIFVSCQGVVYENHLESISSHTLSDLTPLHCSNEHSSFYNTKVLFILDKTSSNKKFDPKGLQIQNIKRLVQDNQLGIEYGVIAFSKDKVLFPLSSYQVPIFTSDTSRVLGALSRLEKEKNIGKINYSQVFKAIKKSLDFDTYQNENKVTDYHLVFVSGDSLEAPEAEKSMFAHQLKEIEQDKNLHVHSIYYGNNETKKPVDVTSALKTTANFALTAYIIAQGGIFFPKVYDKEDKKEEGDQQKDNQHASFLKSISSEGSYKTNLSKNSFQLSDSWEVKHFMVYNLNASECRDGVVRLDSDQDGICDQDEMALEGFNHKDKFSFNDGYSDAFHYIAISKSIMLPNCDDRSDVDHDLLTHCEEKYLNSRYSSQTNEVLLKTDNPDSDGDGLIDGIETLLFLRTHLLSARDPKNLLSSNLEGINIKERLVLSKPDNEQLQYKTELIPLRGEESSCYVLKQKVMPVYSYNTQKTLTENTVFVYFLKKQRESDKTVYQFKYEKVHSAGLFTKEPFYSSMQDKKLQHYSF